MSRHLAALVMEFLTALSQGRSREVHHLLDANATWWINGSTPLSGERPVAELLALVRPVFARTRGPMKVEFRTLTAEADRVAVEMQVQACFDDGRHYSNDVHFVLRFAGERIVSIKEYLDTEALSNLLQVHD